MKILIYKALIYIGLFLLILPFVGEFTVVQAVMCGLGIIFFIEGMDNLLNTTILYIMAALIKHLRELPAKE